MLELEGDYGHGFLYYCFSNNGVIEELCFYFLLFILRTRFRAILVALGIDAWGSLQIVTLAKTTGGSIMWTRRRGWGG